jgi:hypothetical protein
MLAIWASDSGADADDDEEEADEVADEEEVTD